MAIRFTCPQCQYLNCLDAASSGDLVTCSNCGRQVRLARRIVPVEVSRIEPEHREMDEGVAESSISKPTKRRLLSWLLPRLPWPVYVLGGLAAGVWGMFIFKAYLEGDQEAIADKAVATVTSVERAAEQTIISRPEPQPRTLTATPLNSQVLDLPTLTKKTAPAVVLLTAFDSSGEEISEGTGFLISSDGKLATNLHVIRGAARCTAKSEDGRTFEIDGILGQDSKSDLCILKLKGSNLPFLSLGSGASVERGMRIAVIGSPLGLQGTLSEGIVSSIRDRGVGSGRQLQITAPISPGSSGSPVIDHRGEVVGVATLIFLGGQSLNFAVPVEELSKLISSTQNSADLRPLRQAKVATLGPIESDADFWVARDAETAGDYSTMLERGKSLVKRYPNDAQSHLLVGSAHINMESWEEAVGPLSEVVRLMPNNEDAYCLLGLAYFRLDRLEPAAEAFEKAIKANPTSVDAWKCIGSVRLLQGLWAKATVAFKKCLELEPEDAETWFLLGRCHLESEAWKDATDAFRQVVRLDPKKCDAWCGLAISYMPMKRWKDSTDAAAKAVQIDAASASAWHALALAYAGGGQKDKARSAWQKLRSIDSTMAASIKEFIK